ncbi:Trp biosynthesis-associated membrane protein [Nocardioides alcanivorans]|uniref:Trp biosynthesis-associated membrane protein n=1 Tax=Nocardioides alcanivorans TaxID=2897352 RepID=UPI001F2E273C|nr:Trp biosynthesis-associated membrane protein [Nocardioides alcanivorans]
MAEKRRTHFGPLVLAGLATGVLTAVAATKQMMRVDPQSLSDAGVSEDLMSQVDPSSHADLPLFGTGLPTVSGDLPLAAGLALVLLACWGVLLVTRGRVRVAMAGLLLVAALGVLVALVAGYLTGTDSYAEAVASRLGNSEGLTDHIVVEPTGWFWTACIGATLSVVVAGLSLRFVRSWPTMGGRYDAPGTTQATPAAAPEERSNLDLWKALDEGEDPTA